jgi:hypothetical protein
LLVERLLEFSQSHEPDRRPAPTFPGQDQAQSHEQYLELDAFNPDDGAMTPFSADLPQGSEIHDSLQALNALPLLIFRACPIAA